MPVKINGLENIISIASGGAFSIALKADGTVWEWGRNVTGLLGNDDISQYSINPVQRPGLNHIMAVAAGSSTGYALKKDGSLWVWGGNGLHQVEGLNNVYAVAVGLLHTLVLKNDGTVWTWGWNDKGQLGDGGIKSRTIPVQVKGLSRVKSIAAGA